MSDVIDIDPRMSHVADLANALGFQRIVRFEEGVGRVAIEYRVGPHMCHTNGTIAQGGFVTGWIDQAMGFCVIAATGRTMSPLSLEIKVSFLKSVPPGLVIAEGWVEMLGRKTGFLEGRLLDSSGAVLAKGTSTVKLVKLGA